MTKRNPNARQPRHGHASGGKRSPTYESWSSMVARCTRPSYGAYPNYGAKGITVCDKWLKFVYFLWDMGERPEGTTLDRIDNSKGYFKENCRWATLMEQGANQTTNVLISFGGETLHMSEWARRLGITPDTLWHRLNSSGLTVEDALTMRKSQQPEHKKNTVYVNYKGERRTLRSVADEAGVDRRRLYMQLRGGRTIEEAIRNCKEASAKRATENHSEGAASP